MNLIERLEEMEGAARFGTKSKRYAPWDEWEKAIETVRAMQGALRGCLEKGSRWHPCDPVVVAAREALRRAEGNAG